MESDDAEFQFDLPFSDLSPLSPKQKNSASGSVQRQLQFDKQHRKLYFKSNVDSNDEEEDADDDEENNESDDEDDDKELLRDFDVIDVLPGFGEPPRNNQEFEIKVLKSKSASSASHNPRWHAAGSNCLIEIKEDHFKKPLTKIDVLKAPDTYPCPLNVYCIQEISINWCLYGGSDFGSGQSGKSEETSSEQQALSISPASK